MMRLTAAALAALLAVATAAAAAQSALPTPHERGRKAFQKCYSCHSVDPEETGLPGPNLAAVVGGPIAARTDFEYSPALIAFSREEPAWTPSLLARYLADPEQVVPGTLMSFVGLRSLEERPDVIRYLQGLLPEVGPDSEETWR